MKRASVVEDESDFDLIFGFGGEHSPHVGSLKTRPLAEIEAKPVSWLWPGRIPRGKLTIIAGNPGVGKSQITASIAAVITTGGCWPVDGHNSARGAVLFLTAEDDAADTLRTRLEAAGADVNQVHIVEGVLDGYTGDGTPMNRLFSLAKDLDALSQKLRAMPNVAALIIDPISAYLGHTDSHRNAEVRALLAPLGEIAARHNLAMIGISHLTKNAGEQALMRVSGSLAFVAAARAAYLVAQDRNDDARPLLVPMKNNFAQDKTGLAYRIEGVSVLTPAGAIETARVMWEAGPVSITGDEVMQSLSPTKISALNHAKKWLLNMLSEGRSLTTKEPSALAEKQDISGSTLGRAAKSLRIKPRKQGMEGPWLWSLPEDGQLP
jgi:putative DNA primase/helicase